MFALSEELGVSPGLWGLRILPAGTREPGREWEDESFSGPVLEPGGAAGSTRPQMEEEILPGGLHMSDELLRLK